MESNHHMGVPAKKRQAGKDSWRTIRRNHIQLIIFPISKDSHPINKYYLFLKIQSNILKTLFRCKSSNSLKKNSAKTKIEKIQLKKKIQYKIVKEIA